ncbi:MAG TPA: TetR/AcrR family transcriptional regulator [Rhizomicrobium sp.]|jgi:AcrR family transcriptional regulator
MYSLKSSGFGLAGHPLWNSNLTAGLMTVRAKARSRPKERYERRRLEVLHAAARTFNIRGFHVATLDDVADELGVTKPAIYYYAKSKDELLSACAQMALEALEAALRNSRTPDPGPPERVRRFFAFYAETICEDFGRCLVLTEPRDLAPASRKTNIAARRALNRGVREIIREGIAVGIFRPCDDLALASAMFDAINGLAKWFDPKGATPLPKMVQEYLDIFLYGVTEKPTGSSRRARQLPKQRASKV